MKRTYKKTTYYAGKINKYVREWVEKLKNNVYYDNTVIDDHGGKHRLIIREGSEFRARESIDYGD